MQYETINILSCEKVRHDMAPISVEEDHEKRHDLRRVRLEANGGSVKGDATEGGGVPGRVKI